MSSDFPQDWQVLPIKQCMEAIIDYRGKSPKKTSSGIPLITAKIVKNGRILPPDEYIQLEDYDNWMRRGIPQKGDVVITTEAPLGEVAQLDDRKVALAQRIITLRGKPDVLDNSFLKFALQSEFVQNQLQAHATGTTVHGIRQSELVKIKLPIPPLSIQQDIANILSSLDDKIEINHLMNKTIKEIVQALFNSWFLNFDPVRAKIEGKPPKGMNEVIAGLFPNEFESVDERKIPKGWTIEKIRERTSNIQYGLTRSASLDKNGLKFLRITDIQGGIINWNNVPYCEVSQEEIEKYRIKKGDVFVARTGASTGENIYIIDTPESIFASYLVRFQFNDLSTARIVGEFMRTPLYFDYIRGAIGGSAQPNASAQLLASISFVFPPREIADAFFSIIEPFDKMRSENEKQLSTLIVLRDTLLPKLISGEILISLSNEVPQ